MKCSVPNSANPYRAEFMICKCSEVWQLYLKIVYVKMFYFDSLLHVKIVMIQ